ncbi:MAG: polysaccharide deacetylase family protein [Saprospirales bacterium]|nr:polysaccharide deacetylase family protein [Saprospirales bacterium]MBK8921241.1 polysaccharide deacetylase family protein [Saprospirales bacterium]
MKTLSPPVLYFHSVAPRAFSNWTLRFLTMRLERFEEQMRYLQANAYRSVFLDEWLSARLGQRQAGKREICLTFDDGLLDNWVYAFPVAKKYGMRITLFVCPELVDPRDIVRPTLDDVWAGRCQASDLVGLGNLSWSELRRMQASGFADVQSHTMSHAKYTVSSRLTGYYYGGFKGFYPALNTYSADRKPFYMDDPAFEKVLPAGTPLFEEASAVVARKHTIHPGFTAEVTELASRYELAIPEHRPVFEEHARRIYQRFTAAGQLVTGVEQDDAFRQRLEYEIIGSRQIIEEKLGKPVHFLCWPHGDNSAEAHALARTAGYLATTAGKLTREAGQPDRIPRIGTDWDLGNWWMRRKLDYKLASHNRKLPYYAIWLANEYKNNVLNRS